VPAYGTWNVYRTQAGVKKFVGNTGNNILPANTLVTVHQFADQFEVSIDGSVSFSAPEGPTTGRAGLLAGPKEHGDTKWTRFEASGSGLSPAGTRPVSTTTTAVTSTTAPPTAPTVRPASQVTILVANGTQRGGLGQQTSDALKALGYVTLEPTNTPSPVDTSSVYFEVGYEPEAKAAANALGLSESTVAALPFPPPVPLGTARVLVVLGEA
jgi:hypothetical protein